MNLNFQNGVLAHFGLPKMEAGEKLTPEGAARVLAALERAFEKTHKTTDRQAMNDFVTLKAFCVEMGVDPAPTLRRVMGQPEPLPPGAIHEDEAPRINRWLEVHLVPFKVEGGKVPNIPDATREQIAGEYLRSLRKNRAGHPSFDAERLRIDKQFAGRLDCMPSPERIARELEGE